MTQEKTNNIEIDLGQFFRSIGKGLKNLLKLGINVFLFYKRNWILFSILFIVGIIGGYFIESGFSLNKKQKQDIIIHPKYSTAPYIYSFVENIGAKIKDTLFLKEVNLDTSDIKYLKEVTIEPIIQSRDVLDQLQTTYKGQNFFNQFMESYDEKTLKSDKYKSFFKYHTLSLIFKKENHNNAKVAKHFLEYITANEHYNKELAFNLKQARSNLDRNKKTLAFIEDYLNKLNDKSLEQKQEVIIVGDESKIPTIASLLDKKKSLLQDINFQEETLEMNTQLVDIVQYDNIVPFPTPIYKRVLLLFPIILCLVVSFLFLIKHSSKKIEDFINS